MIPLFICFWGQGIRCNSYFGDQRSTFATKVTFTISKQISLFKIFVSTLWAKNFTTHSWRQLGVYYTPYELPK